MIHHPRPAEAAGESSASLRLEASLPCQKPGQGVHQGFYRGFFYIHAGLSLVNRLGGAGQAGCQGRNAAGCRFKIDNAEPFMTVARYPRSEHHEIRARIDVEKLLSAHKAGKSDPVGEAQLGGEPLEPHAIMAVTDHRISKRMTILELRKRVKNEVDILARLRQAGYREQPRDAVLRGLPSHVEEMLAHADESDGGSPPASRDPLQQHALG